MPQLTLYARSERVAQNRSTPSCSLLRAALHLTVPPWVAALVLHGITGYICAWGTMIAHRMGVFVGTGAIWHSAPACCCIALSAGVTTAVRHCIQIRVGLMSCPCCRCSITSELRISNTSTLHPSPHSLTPVNNRFNELRKDRPHEWKCQPTKQLAEKLHSEEVCGIHSYLLHSYHSLMDNTVPVKVRWGCINAFFAGAVGCTIFLQHLNRPFMRCHWSSNQSWLGFLGDCLVVFFWIELWAYCAHR